ncbi:MAG: hypothetical protein WC479_07340 [Candidatus Izemoplasmatales bacterium]
MVGKIDTNLRWLRVVKTRPVSYEWSNRYQTALYLVVKPLKTSLALVVENITIWLTSFPNLINQTPFRLAGR